MKKLFRRNRKGISTIIATIIIVAISIVMAIAVAYWALGIGGSFTRFEKLEFTSAYASFDTNSKFTIYMTIKNTGSAAATIDNSTIFYNGKPASAYVIPTNNNTFCPSAPLGTIGQLSMDPGNSITPTITLQGGSGSPWVSGMTVEVMIQTTAGRQYPKVVVLP